MWKISSDFGDNWKETKIIKSSLYYYPETNGKHYGVDQVFKNENNENKTIGQEIKATKNGVVTESFFDDKGGNLIRIKTDENSYLTFCHLSKRNVVVGNKIKIGDIIGLAGGSGSYCTGAHLHSDEFYFEKPNVNYIERIYAKEKNMKNRFYVYPKIQEN